MSESDNYEVKLTVKSSTFSPQQDLFIQFKHRGKTYHTMSKDGEGRHVIWDQKFDVNWSPGNVIEFSCMDGSPLSSRLVGATRDVNLVDELKDGVIVGAKTELELKVMGSKDVLKIEGE